MRIQTASIQQYSPGLWIVALVLVAAAGLALGRWAVPAGDTTAPAPVTADAPSFFGEVEPGSTSAGHVIGMTFDRAPATVPGTGFVGAASDSPGEGHVIGITFDRATATLPGTGFVGAASDSPGEGHVIGMTFDRATATLPGTDFVDAASDSPGEGHVIGMTFQ